MGAFLPPNSAPNKKKWIIPIIHLGLGVRSLLSKIAFTD